MPPPFLNYLVRTLTLLRRQNQHDESGDADCKHGAVQHEIEFIAGCRNVRFGANLEGTGSFSVGIQHRNGMLTGGQLLQE